MDFSVDKDRSGRLVCTLYSEGQVAIVTSSNAASAGSQLRAALDDARQAGYGECLWQEAVGEYRWVFRRTGERLTVVVLWSSGTLTGWQHVLHAETDLETFVRQMGSELARMRAVEDSTDTS